MRHRVFDNETHPSWRSTRVGAYYGRLKWAVAIGGHEDGSLVLSWQAGDKSQGGINITELRAVVLLASDPEELMRHYSGRGPE